MVQFRRIAGNNPMSETTLINNRYQIEETLGKGGMAVVYKAHDLTLDRDVAIKVLRQKYSIEPAFREHFQQEAKAAANLSHPNIVTVYDFGFDSDRFFIIMEYVPGSDIKQIQATRGHFNLKETLHLMQQACAGVGYAHRVGLVHCDIKPQNLLVTPDKMVKIVDFGIARALASVNPDEKADIVWGSPSYFSPEQAAGLAPSPASDVYSLGVIMYEMLTGDLPFSAQTPTELARKHRQEMPLSPRELNPEIPPEVELILLKTLAKEPAGRYRTADQLGQVLKAFEQKSISLEFPKPQTQMLSSAATAETQPYEAPLSPPPITQDKNPLDIDWITISLALLAVIAAGGLIPFFLWVYFVYNPPLR
jgi:serine/threonine protein kinase